MRVSDVPSSDQNLITAHFTIALTLRPTIKWKWHPHEKISPFLLPYLNNIATFSKCHSSLLNKKRFTKLVLIPLQKDYPGKSQTGIIESEENLFLRTIAWWHLFAVAFKLITNLILTSDGEIQHSRLHENHWKFDVSYREMSVIPFGRIAILFCALNAPKIQRTANIMI